MYHIAQKDEETGKWWLWEGSGKSEITILDHYQTAVSLYGTQNIVVMKECYMQVTVSVDFHELSPERKARETK